MWQRALAATALALLVASEDIVQRPALASTVSASTSNVISDGRRAEGQGSETAEVGADDGRVALKKTAARLAKAAKSRQYEARKRSHALEKAAALVLEHDKRNVTEGIELFSAAHPILAESEIRRYPKPVPVAQHYFGSNLAFANAAVPPKGSKPRVLLSFGTRPEAVKMAPVVQECKKLGNEVETWVMSSGQHGEMIDDVMANFDLAGVIDFNLDVMTFNQTLSGVSTKVLEQTSKIIKTLSPDAVVVQGDTTTAAFVAWAAFYLKVPVVHVEAGLRTRNINSPFPEEANRNGIGSLASLHFPATPWARQNLLGESKHAYQIVMTGNPVVDALYQTLKKPISPVVKSVRGWLKEATCNRMVLLTAHRRENQGARLKAIVSASGRLLKKHGDVCIVYPVHPNPNIRQSVEEAVPSASFARLSARATAGALESGTPLPPLKGEFLDDQAHFERLALIGPVAHDALSQLMKDAYIILTDSGGIQEEGVSVGKPVLILRDETERPEVVIAGGGVLCGEERPGGGLASKLGARVELEADLLLAPPPNAHYDRMSGNARDKHIYGDGFAAEYIAHELVNRIKYGFTNKSIVPVVAYKAANTGGHQCWVGPYDADWDRVAAMLMDKLGPGLAFARYADGELGVAQQRDIGNAEWHFKARSDGDGSSPQITTDLIASLKGHLGQNYFYAFASPLDGAAGLRWLLERTEVTCGFVTYANIWVNSNYPRTKSLIDKLVNDTYKGKVVVVVNQESVAALRSKGQLGETSGAWATDALALPDNLVSQWSNVAAHWKAEAETIARKHSGALFMVSGGPVAEILISWMWDANPNNKYVDFGSALDPLLRGKITREYQNKGAAPSQQVDPRYLIRGPLAVDTEAEAGARAEAEQEEQCDVVVVFTVWRRTTLDWMMSMLSKQTVLRTHRVCVTVFQNAIHLNVGPILDKWRQYVARTNAFALDYVVSHLETGYFGRFGIPLTAYGARTATYWAVFDDDVIYGSRYLENSIRVNDEGYFCTRNGRMVDKSGKEVVLNSQGWREIRMQANTDYDPDWDFGGHIWVVNSPNHHPKMQWLRWIWRNPPPTVATAEDFWMSAVLKARFGIGTRTARCPSKGSEGSDIQLCACSMHPKYHAVAHFSALVGGEQVDKVGWKKARTAAILSILEMYSGPGSLHTPEVRSRTAAMFSYTRGNDPRALNITGTEFEKCRYWV